MRKSPTSSTVADTLTRKPLAAKQKSESNAAARAIRDR